MDGPARSAAALARIEEQREQISTELFKINLQLRKMALNLTVGEVERLKVNKKDGPGAYVRLYDDHALVEKRAKHDTRILNAQEKAIKIGLKKGVFNDFHLKEYPLESDVETEAPTTPRSTVASIVELDDEGMENGHDEAPNEAQHDGLDAFAAAWSMQGPKADETPPAVPIKPSRRLALDAITTEPLHRDKATAEIGKEHLEQLAKGQTITHRVYREDGTSYMQTLEWK